MPLTQRTQVMAAVFAVLLVASGVAAVLVDSDSADTALGAVAGMSTALLVSVVLIGWLGTRQERRRADRQALDSLDPLGSARRDGR